MGAPKARTVNPTRRATDGPGHSLFYRHRLTRPFSRVICRRHVRSRLVISSWPALTADGARLGAVLVQRALPVAAQRESRVSADDKPKAVVKAGGWQPRAEVLGGILALAAE